MQNKRYLYSNTTLVKVKFLPIILLHLFGRNSNTTLVKVKSIYSVSMYYYNVHSNTTLVKVKLQT